MQNPNYAALLPNRNPTGGAGAPTASTVPSIGSSSGANPVLPATNIPSGAPATNAYDPTSVIPSFGANSGPYTSTNLASSGSGGASPVGSFANLSPSQIASAQRDLNRTYGEGLGNMIMSFLQGGAGFNQQAINNLFAALQPGINRGEEDLMQQFSTSGNRFSSGAQIGLADYLSQVNLNEGQIEAQMYETSVQDYINTLMDVANKNMNRKAAEPSLFEKIVSPLVDITGGGGGGGSSSGGGGGIGQSLMEIVSSLALA